MTKETKAAATETAAPMTETDTVAAAHEETMPDPNERVKIRINKVSPNEEPNLFVAVNGVNYLIPKGKTVEVPRFVRDEIERSDRARDAFFQTVEELRSINAQ